MLTQLLLGCGTAHQSIPIDFRIHITDPVYRKLAGVADRVSLKASGVLTEGSYTIQGVPIKVSGDTTFKLDVTLPIHGSSDLTTKDVSGSMSTNRPITVLNVPAPLTIQLHNGAGSADVDLARVLVAFILNSLQGSANSSLAHSNQSGDRPLSELLSAANVDSAQLDLKEGSSLQFPSVSAKLGPKSTIQFTAVHFDRSCNYTGMCAVHLRLPHFELDEDKAHRKLELDNAEINLNVEASKNGNTISLKLPTKSSGLLSAAGTKISAPGADLAFAQGAIKLDNCVYLRTLGQEEAEISMDGIVTIKNASVYSRLNQSADGRFDLEGLDGNLQFTNADRKIKSDGKFNVNISSSENTIGIKGAHAAIRGLKFHSDQSSIAIDVPSCRLVIPSTELRNAVVRNIPKKRIFEVNKVVYEGRKWRYRKFRLQRVIVSNPALNKLKVTGKDKFTFSASSDIAANGTVEKFELHPLRPGQRISWSALPWSAHSFVNGNGAVTAKFLPGPNLAASTVQYKVACKMPVPEKLEIDWSHVSGDILGNAERALIEKVVQNADYFVDQKGIPINFDGEIQPFKRKNAALKAVRVRSFTLTAAPEEVVIELNIGASF